MTLRVQPVALVLCGLLAAGCAASRDTAAEPEERSVRTTRGGVEVRTGGWPGTDYPIRLTFTPPGGWTATASPGTLNSCLPVLAVVRAVPLDPCVRSGVEDPDKLAASAASGQPVVWIWTARRAETLPVEWLVAWNGLAASLLPAWTSRFEPVAAPHAVTGAGRGAVAFSLAGPHDGTPLRVDAVLVRRAGWVMGVAAASRDPAGQADLVHRLAAGLRVSTR